MEGSNVNKNTSSVKNNPLTRSTDKIIGGVASGLAEYLNIDKTVVRMIFIVLVLFSGTGVVLYLALWLLLPSKIDAKLESKEVISNNFNEFKEFFKTMSTKLDVKQKGLLGYTLAFILILVGLIVLKELHIYTSYMVFPFLVVLVGLYWLLKK